MTDDNFIELRGVRKLFGTVAAVEHVDMNIARGAFFSLLGASGCGKTTLLSMLGGLEYPSAGSILIDGTDVTRVPPYRRPTNTVFQSYAIFPHLSVGDNIGYGLRRAGLDKAARGRKVDEMLDLIRMNGFGERTPDQLSGGQRQRVALARALVLQPKVLLSRCRRWTRAFATRCSRSCAPSSARWASPSCSSPTTRKKPLRCPTGSR